MNNRKTSEYLFRILSTKGTYPGCTLSYNGIHYEIIEGIPTLLTKYNSNAERKYNKNSEFTIIGRNELKAATCFILSMGDALGTFYFDNNNYDNQIFAIEKNVSFNKQLKEIFDNYKSNCISFPVVSEYDYFDFSGKIDIYKNLIQKYTINNHLLLRTSNYLLKSLMLRSEQFFMDDAMINAALATVGCIELIKRKHGNYSDSYDPDLIEIVAKEIFEYPEGAIEFIEDVYKYRIMFVHPVSNKYGEDWIPVHSADDLLDYYEILKGLFIYALNKKPLPPRHAE